MHNISIFPHEMLVFVDETGTDMCDILCRYSYSLRGKPAQALSMYSRGSHFSAISAMCMDGVLACKIVDGGVNAQTFETFLCMDLASNLMPFNGVNPMGVSLSWTIYNSPC